MRNVAFVSTTNTPRAELEENVCRNLARGLPEHLGTACCIVGGGPSAVDLVSRTVMRSLERTGRYVVALNGAWRVCPADVVVAMDPRPEMLEILPRTIPMLLASQMHPSVFDGLVGCNVTMWHAAGTDAVKGLHAIKGGGTVLSRAINLMFERGYRNFRLFGVDSSLTDGKHHAYPQPINDDEPTLPIITPGGAEFVTTPAFAQQAQDVCRQMVALEDFGAAFAVHGSGLLPKMWREHRTNEDNNGR